MTVLHLPKPVDIDARAAALEKQACEMSLSEFIKRAWKQIEPAQHYFHNWHIDYVSAHLEAIEREERIDGEYYNRLLVNVPPGMMKSMQISVFFPAWLWEIGR